MSQGNDADVAMGAMMLESYFPTQIFYRDFDGAEPFNQALARDIRAWRDADPDGIQRSNARRAGSWHSPVDMHERPEFASLRDRIQTTAQDIAAACAYSPKYELTMDTMWGNINPPGGYNRLHNHPHSLWSGVYWVLAPQEAGRIVFQDPREARNMAPPVYDPDRTVDAAQWNTVNFEPSAGRLVLFPSWLYHEVEVNRCPLSGEAGERISVSFNFQQVRRRALG